MLPVGFADSSFTRTRAEFGGTILHSSAIGVLPIEARTLIRRAKLFFGRFWNRFLRRLKADFGMGAVAKRLCA
jgi:hypothetical protein